jgi:hypothetical protein
VSEPEVVPFYAESLGVLAWLPTDEGAILGPVGLSGAMVGPNGPNGFVLRFVFKFVHDGPTVHGDELRVRIADTIRVHRITRYALGAGDVLTASFDMNSHFDVAHAGPLGPIDRKMLRA